MSGLQRLRERWRFVILGRDGLPTMVRYRLLSTRWGGCYVHHFLRSDQDRDLHDHPWHFTSLILWGGYVEELPDARVWPWNGSLRFTVFRPRRPGSIVRHRAHDVHRVVLGKDCTAWTLIWVSPRVREWGFHTKDGWVPWQEYPG